MSQYLGDISAYALAVSQGYTGTEEEYAELMASYATVGQTAVTAAQTATTKASEAATSATTATNKASEATTAATTATNKAAEAQADADAAALDASQAMSAASTATTKATEATTAAATAVSAKDDAVSANTAAQTAQTGAETAAASVEASAEQIATNAADISQLKSEITALESDGAVPTAEQILSDKGVTDSVPYHYRKTGGDGADRLYDQIVGGTVCWNQLADFSAVSIPSASNGISYAYTDGTSVKITGTATAGEQRIGWFGLSELRNLPLSRLGCMMLIVPRIVSGSFDGSINYGIGSSKLYPIGTPYIGPLTNSNTNQIRFQHIITEGTVCTDLVLSFNVFDLTAMFGSTIADYIYSLEQTTAGAGVAFFKSLFPNDYYPYNVGELVSVSGLSAHKMTGFNQWDEEWRLGQYGTSNGEYVADTTHICCTNPIKAVAGATYYFNTAGANAHICFMDADMKLISSNININNATITAPANAKYIVFNMGQAYGTTYKGDICINLSDPAKNGTYEPYKAHSYLLDSTLTLRGIPKLVDGKMCFDGDIYDADGTVTRKYGIVDLGTLDWAYSNGYFDAGVSINVPTKTQWEYQTGQCSRYNVERMFYVINAENRIDNCIAWYSTAIRVSDSAYTDAATFKTAMSGVMLVYELATPTTEEADPYQHLQQCDPDGTEEYVSTGIVPIGHNSFYPENLRAKVEGLPWNFASLIAPTESTFTATRNYTTGSLFIVSNVLYKATSNIANGGAITPNTNCTATTLAEIISALA